MGNEFTGESVLEPFHATPCGMGSCAVLLLIPLEEIFSNTFSAYFDAKNKVDFSDSFSRGMVLNHFFDNQFSLLQSKLYHREKVKISSDK